MTALGIDLGTTYSVVAVMDADTSAEHSTTRRAGPRVLPNRDGETLTPSVVYFNGEDPVVGTPAKLAAALAPPDCVELVKRHMGDPSWRFDTAGGTTYTAEEISALILQRLSRDADSALDTPCREAVITVPAYFDDARRRATTDAGIIAGLDVLGVINEPTAAALAFGYGTARTDTLLVYDLGGGTFDVTVVRIANGEYTVLATAGDRNLGGFDFDNALMRYVDEMVQAKGGPSLLDDDLAEVALRERCEQAKRTLSALPDTVINVDAGGNCYPIEATRPRFEQLTKSLLRRTEEIVTETMADAGINPGELSSSLLVGGSTRMPMVAGMLEKVTGVRTNRSVHPDEAVALGAAIHADALVERRRAQPTGGRGPRRAEVLDVTAHSLGLIARSAETGEEINSIVIERNSPLPAQGSRRFHTLAENQPEILVVITEGEDRDPEYVTIVGSAHIPIAPSQYAVKVDVVLGYDSEGMIHVTVVDANSGESLGEFHVDRQANVDAEEVYRMRQALQNLGLR